MGVRLVSIGDGVSELELVVEPHHLNPGGIVHGGIIATILDAAIGIALRTQLPRSQSHVTVQLDVRYFAPARGGALIARGNAVQSGGRIAFGDGELRTDDDQIVAKATGTFLAVTRSDE